MNNITIGTGLSRECTCKGCKDRYVGCHSKCETYLAFKEKNDKLKDKILKESQLANAASEMSRYKGAGGDLRKRSSRSKFY